MYRVNLHDENQEKHAPANSPLPFWLWASRFFKTRKTASESVRAGHVAVNGHRAKPAKQLRVGDKVRIRKNHLEYTVTVLRLSPNRLAAPLASALYRETAQI